MRLCVPRRVLRRAVSAAAVLAVSLGAVWACTEDRLLNARPQPGDATPPRFELTDVSGSNQPVALALLNAPARCLTLRDESGANGTPVVIAACAGAASERFTWTNDGEIHIAVAGVSKCVSSNGPAGNAGDVVVLWDCGATANQRWTATAWGEIQGLNGRCLDVYDNAAEGAQTVLWNCYGVNTPSWQQWAARGSGRNVVLASTTDPGKCLEIQNNTTANGTWLIVNPCTGGADQRFTWQTNGEIRSFNGDSPKCLTVQGSGNAGEVIYTWDCVGAPTQRWQANPSGEIRGPNGLCLDVYDNAVPGARAVLWQCYGGPWQRWADRVTVGGAAACGVSFTAVVTNDDALLAAYGIPATSDPPLRVCQTWTGNDYVVRETAAGSTYNAFQTPDAAQAINYSAGQITAFAADGGAVQAPVDVGPTAFDFMQADAATRQAAYDDPYHAVYAAPDPPCGGTIRCSVAVTAGVQAAGAGPDTGQVDAPKFAKHGLKRRGVRALVDDAQEIGRSAKGHRQFQVQHGDTTTVFGVDPATELLAAQERREPGRTVKATHTWQKGSRGEYVRARTDIETTEVIGGAPRVSRTTLTLSDLVRGTDAPGGSVPAAMRIPSTSRRRTP